MLKNCLRVSKLRSWFGAVLQAKGLVHWEVGEIGADEYEEILYDGLFSLIDDLLEPLEDPGMIHVTNKNTFLFMQDNTPCHKATVVLEFLAENNIPIIE